MNVRQKQSTGNITMWENSNNGEKFVFWDEPQKIYKKGGQVIDNYPSMFKTSKKLDRFIMAMHPLMLIYTEKYDNKSCYHITMFGITEIIEKDTGLVLYDNNNIERRQQYTFNTVTDEDVKLPNLEEYTFRE